MPTLYIAEYQSFGALEIEQALDSSKVKDTKATAQKIFNELKDFASDEKHSDFLAHKTKHTLKAKNYVGTIQTKSGFCVEILPKTFAAERITQCKKVDSSAEVDRDQKVDSREMQCKHTYRFEREKIFEAFSKFSEHITAKTVENAAKTAQATDQATATQTTPQILPTPMQHLCAICHAKAILLNCLATLKDTPFKHNHLANLHTLRLPLLEIYVRMFIDECERLVRAGLKGDYLCIAQNRAFLKGKLEFKDHIAQNFIHKERFYTSSDEYTQDIAPNRLIQSTLRLLACLSLHPSTRSRLDTMRFIFADISPSENIQRDFTHSATMSRAKEYETILLWCRVFLEQRAFSPYSGSDKAVAFVFPMEKLFESFVSFWLKQCADKDLRITTQESSKYLLCDEGGKKIFCLMPDIIMRAKKGAAIIIADTKWKIPNSSTDEKKYGISQGDLYQMWAYASKYRLESKNVRVVLIYPQCERTKKLEKEWQHKQWSFKASLESTQCKKVDSSAEVDCHADKSARNDNATAVSEKVDSSAKTDPITISLAFAPLG